MLTLINSTVSQNLARCEGGSCSGLGFGGGIYNEGTLMLSESTVSGNRSAAGGGIYNEGTLMLSESTVSGNTATTGHGGGISNVRQAAVPTATLTNSTVSGNTADLGGGGIYNEGDGSTVTLANTTVSGNTSTVGGGISSSGTVTLTNSTVSANTALAYGGIWSGGTLALTNSLVDGDCVTGLGATTTSNGYNIESPGDTCGFDPDGTDQVNVSDIELNIGELADNGGPTMTHALGLLPTRSVAIDQIPAEDCEVQTDQRGEPRPAGTTDPKLCDVGAFEVQP
jgi:predicted outer membrane repeat protein